MRNYLLSAMTVILLGLTAQAQEPSVEKSIFGVQTGVLGVWGHNEVRLSTKISLRSEIGLNSGFFSGTENTSSFILFPIITVEPRYYYNLVKRFHAGKNTQKNSANFLTAKVSYVPDWFKISNESHISVADGISITPKWGIKRTISKHFTYEAGIGMGYYALFDSNENGVAVDIHLRIGYTF